MLHPYTPKYQVIDAPPKLRPMIGFQFIPVTEEDLEKPYRVIILNDDVTTFEFVIASLIIVFEVDDIRAEAIAWETHTIGEAYVVTLPYKEAKEKVVRVKTAAREEGYPLDFVIEPEE